MPAIKEKDINGMIEESCLYCGNQGTRKDMKYQHKTDSWFCNHEHQRMNDEIMAEERARYDD